MTQPLGSKASLLPYMCLILSSSLAGSGPQKRDQGRQPVLPGDPEQEDHGEEEELGSLPDPSAPLDGENSAIRTRAPIHLALPGPLFMEGLADSALEDGE